MLYNTTAQRQEILKEIGEHKMAIFNLNIYTMPRISVFTVEILQKLYLLEK